MGLTEADLNRESLGRLFLLSIDVFSELVVEPSLIR